PLAIWLPAVANAFNLYLLAVMAGAPRARDAPSSPRRCPRSETAILPPAGGGRPLTRAEFRSSGCTQRQFHAKEASKQ
ncbi:hypothetical protein ACWDE9_45230, partial [Streptomyces olivaceoviridis]